MNKNTSRGPGRPAYEVKYPVGKFTMADLMERNGVNLKTGKGKFCTKLTLVKAMARDAAKKSKSFIVKLDETREPNSKSGLGRKTFVYIRRAKAAVKSAAPASPAPKAAVKPVKKAKSTKTASNYEATKAALLAPVPAVTITPTEAAPVESKVESQEAPAPTETGTTETETAPVAESNEPVAA